MHLDVILRAAEEAAACTLAGRATLRLHRVLGRLVLHALAAGGLDVLERLYSQVVLAHLNLPVLGLAGSSILASASLACFCCFLCSLLAFLISDLTALSLLAATSRAISPFFTLRERSRLDIVKWGGRAAAAWVRAPPPSV
eukprot:CAMPEP_0180016900 /NCGR_PEP_ID=MMETSP0984-20121128/19590_1 /TAXON_ID=483367 /ORGANISM="non described non described, Strain CCMP 2436" /LENGTH=140 /DNA_ID=CAMNT_0021939939 /DNA_START=450 /DNA_END=870 /DNA_ORIENTATION=-